MPPNSSRGTLTRLALAALGAIALAAVTFDSPLDAGDARAAARKKNATRTACEGKRAPLPDVLLYELRAAAFPGFAHPDVAVHVPRGFDGTRRPGLLVYFHGWQGCVTEVLSSDDQTACSDAGPEHPGENLAAEFDAAGVNALLVAVELRVDMSTGEPGRLAMPGGFRELLRELFVERLAGPLGCQLDVDALDRVVIVAHSGGYQAAASALRFGDVPRVTEVDLLDALYGADDVFLRWMTSQVGRFDPRALDRLRFVDLYTCCGGTAERSRALEKATHGVLGQAGLAFSLYDDDGASDVAPSELMHSVVFKRVPRAHGELPRAYLHELVENAGFARIVGDGSHSLRLN